MQRCKSSGRQSQLAAPELSDNRNKEKCNRFKPSLIHCRDSIRATDPIIEDDVAWVYEKWAEEVDRV